MADAAPELIQFPYSHYNEKARWAFDYKGVVHVRRNVLPGPHAVEIKRLTGQTTVPVVRFSDAIVRDSARIIDELERRHPEPPLYPADPALRARALEVQRHFDDAVGPEVRRMVFALLRDEPAYTCAVFADGQPRAKRLLFRAMVPVVMRVIVREVGLDVPGAAELAEKRTLEALELVAREAGPDGFLVGDAFSVADLAAAALLAPVANPPDSTMERPEPQPARVRALVERFRDHPGIAWVRATYARHRGARA